jgi:hypothetical protein
MFAVMGITGNVGSKVADTLLQHGKRVRGIVRNEAKAAAWKEKGVELITADYDDHLTAAFTGVEGIFAMIPPNLLPDPGFPDSVARIAAIRKAILAAKPPRAVFLSSIGSEKTSNLGLITATHILEQELSSTGVPSAFLRAGSFMENILYSVPAARATGKYFAFYQPLDHPFPSLFHARHGSIPWLRTACPPTDPAPTSKCSTNSTPAGSTSACPAPKPSRAKLTWKPRSKCWSQNPSNSHWTDNSACGKLAACIQRQGCRLAAAGPSLERNLQHVLDVIRRDPGALHRWTPGRRIQLDI